MLNDLSAEVVRQSKARLLFVMRLLQHFEGVYTDIFQS